jgi:hypothetical protein
MPPLLSLLSRHKDFGGLAVFDVSRHVNLTRFRPCFERLTPRPHGSGRFSDAARYARGGSEFERLPGPRLPTHEEATVHRLLDVFSVASAGCTGPVVIGVEFRRLSPSHHHHLMLAGWSRLGGGTGMVGIACASKDQVTGGLVELCSPVDGNTLAKELSPGFMAVFDDREVDHRISEVAELAAFGRGAGTGALDLIVMSMMNEQ